MSDRITEIEKEYVLSKGCFVDVLLLVIGGPLLFFGIVLVLWLGVTFWPVVLLALGTIALLVMARVKQAKTSHQMISEIVDARASLPNDVPGDGRTWVVRTSSGEFAAPDAQLIEEWARAGRLRQSDHVFDADRGCWKVAKDVVRDAYRRP